MCIALCSVENRKHKKKNVKKKRRETKERTSNKNSNLNSNIVRLNLHCKTETQLKIQATQIYLYE